MVIHIAYHALLLFNYHLSFGICFFHSQVCHNAASFHMRSWLLGHHARFSTDVADGFRSRHHLQLGEAVFPFGYL
jgi:hypothetical protein